MTMIRRPGRRIDRGSRRGVVALVAFASFSYLAACGGNSPSYGERVLNAREKGLATGARGDLQNVALGITAYVTSEGNLPEARDIHELADLLENGYSRGIRRTDPWGTDYIYTYSDGSYTLRSAGEDKTPETADDVVLEDGQVTGLGEVFRSIQ